MWINSYEKRVGVWVCERCVGVCKVCVCVKCVGVCQVKGVCWVKYECKVCVIRDRVNCVCVGLCVRVCV